MDTKKSNATSTDDSKLIAALCYVPFFFSNFFVPIYVLLFRKENKHLRFHALQSLLVMVPYLVLAMTVNLVFFIPKWLNLFGMFFSGQFSMPVFFANWIEIAVVMFPLSIIGSLLMIGWLYLAYMAFNGRIIKLPLVGEIAEKYA